MRRRVNLFQRLDRNLCINLGRRQIHMPQNHLDVANIGVILQHMRSHSVPKQMAGAQFIDPHCIHIFFDQIRDPITDKRRTIFG